MMKLPQGLVLLLAGFTLTLAGCGGGTQSSGGGGTSAGSICQSIAIPAYFNPADSASAWSVMTADSPWSSSVSRTIVMNPDSGPGSALDASYQAAVLKAQKAGAKVYGYVPTGYGKDALATAEAEVVSYIDWYGVDGIFVDEVATDATLASSYYQPLVTYITGKLPSGGVLLNPGTYPDESYAKLTLPGTATLRIVVFESDYASFAASAAAPPSWASSYPASLFMDIVYNTSSSQMSNALTLAAGRNVGSVYLTNELMPNPYAALPGYWSSLVSATQAGCK